MVDMAIPATSRDHITVVSVHHLRHGAVAGGEALLPVPAGLMTAVQDPEEVGAECRPAARHMVGVDEMGPVRTVTDAPMAARAIIHRLEVAHAAAEGILVRFNLFHPPPKM